MRKFTFLLMLAFSVYAVGQNKTSIVKTEKKVDKKDNIQCINTQTKALQGTKAVGDIIWADDFSTPSNWVISNELGDCQNWRITTTESVYAMTGIINSTTKTNGFAVFDSDEVGTTCGNEDSAPLQNASLTTANPVDLSAYPNVAIVFEEFYKRWADTTYIGISTDGVNYNYVSANLGIAEGGGSSTNPQVVNLNLSQYAGGQSQVWVRFNFRGDWDYGWFVDDVKLIVSAENELAIETPFTLFYGSGFYSNTPVSQIMDQTLFYAAIWNNGTQVQHNPMLNVKITDNSASTVYDETGGQLQYNYNGDNSMDPDVRDTLYIDTTATLRFTPAAVPASYTAAYTLTQDETDEDLSSNYAELHFNITDTVFGRDVEFKTYTGPARYTSGADGDFIGTGLYFQNADEVRSISVYIPAFTTVSAEGTSFVGKILVDDGSGNLIPKVTTEAYTISASDIGTWVTVPFTLNGGDEFITADTYGYAGLECYWLGISDTTKLYVGADDAPYHDYQASTLLILGGSNYWVDRLPMIRVNVVSSIPCTAFISSKSDVSCFSGNDGEATVDGGGCVAPATYLWSNGQTTQTATGLVAGTYTVTVTDANSSTSTATVVITEPAVGMTATTTGTNLICNGDNTGAIDLTISNGVAPVTYLWSNTATTQDLTGVAAGTYDVTATDANGCTINASVTLTEPTALAITGTPTSPTTFGGSDGSIDITVTGGTTPYTYLWSNAATTEDLTGLVSGTYSVTVTDANNCVINLSVTVLDPSSCSLTITSSQVNVLCNGASTGSATVAATGGSDTFTYLWDDSNAQTTATASNLVAGTYNVTVTDATDNTCYEVVQFTITQPTVLNATTVETNVSCNGGNNGAVNLTVSGGTTPYTYAWSNSATTEDISGLVAGTYSGTVTDGNACAVSGSVTITEPAVLAVTITPTNFNATTAVSGGTAPYTYLWSNGATTAGLTSVAAATYSLTVTDANSCTVTGSVIINSIQDLTGKAINVYPNPTKGLLNIANADNASITVYNIIGETVTSISKASNLTTIDLSNVAEGSYLIRIVSEKQTITKRIYIVK